MEFLDIKLTKDSSLLLPAIHSLIYWWILKKTITRFLVLQIFSKDFLNQIIHE
jgi:hypothetical protein